MKKVYLMRHSIAEKMDIPTSLIPLSEDGGKLAMSKRKDFSDVELCFSSSYKRAIETAELIAKDVNIVDGLQERIIGDAREDFWLKQYNDYDFKNLNGESLNEVKERMKTVIDIIIKKMSEGETALIISHATAICAYLLNYCEIQVIDASCKSRKIILQNKVIMNGTFDPADYFEITFENNCPNSIKYCGKVNSSL